MDNTEFLRYFEEKVKRTIERYSMIDPDDKVIVATSGGKDSTTTLHLLNRFGYSVEAMIIDQSLGEYTERNIANITRFCKDNDIRLYAVKMSDGFKHSVCNMKSCLNGVGLQLNSCAICGMIRRQILNKKCREINATKVATGHNLDDEAQTLFMNLIQGNICLSAKSGPITGVRRYENFVPRIKPLYYCLENETRRYSQLNNFPVVYEPCPCSLNSFRTDIKRILNNLEDQFPGTKIALVENLQGIVPLLREKYRGTGTLQKCEICGEPSNNKICRVCHMKNLVGEVLGS